MPAAGALLGILVAGLLAGIASGLFGLGGGILMVPALLYMIPGTTFHEAKAVSLLVTIGASAIGIWTHHRHRSVDLRRGGILAAGGIVGAIVATLGAERIPDQALTALFGLVLAFTGARLATTRATPRAPAPPTRAHDAALLGIGFGGGLLAGALGIGGGIVMVPGMVLAGVSIHLAVGTSLVAVLANALGGTGTHIALGYTATLITLGGPLALGAIPGTYLGAKLAHRLDARSLRTLFGAGLFLIGAWMLVDATLL